ncbi:hypothetical protein HQQ81_05365 [Microbacteriaceae bacterium VKM Ac-2854]|nr:hypothetical protein [Microbacteriaceae bacterium VKM Ac-2854]
MHGTKRRRGRIIAIALLCVAVILSATWFGADWIRRQPPASHLFDPQATSYFQALGEPRTDVSATQARESVRAAMESARIAAWSDQRDLLEPDVSITDWDVYPCDVHASAVVLQTTLTPVDPDAPRVREALAAIVAAWSADGIVATDPTTLEPGQYRATIGFDVPHGGEAELRVQSTQIAIRVHTACIEDE